VLTIQEYLKQQAELVQQALDQHTQTLTGIPEILRHSIRYSLLAGGKRLRPVFVLATVETLEGDPDKALPFACALEMIHTYSLIHDDLPAMDNDDYRRGKWTNHKVYGEALAILAGDALLTEAFGLMAIGAKKAGLSAEIALTMLAEGAKYAGASGMVGGQVDDMWSENKKITLEELESIHRRKTGALITFAVRTGAMIGGASAELLDILTRFADKLGLAFQIQDDILDVIGDQSIIGKPVGSDQTKHKATYPAILGLEAAQQKLQEMTEAAKADLLRYDKWRPDRLLEIASYLLARDR
jgi:geranylgeranyl diphosphate synthase, type II